MDPRRVALTRFGQSNISCVDARPIMKPTLGENHAKTSVPHFGARRVPSFVDGDIRGKRGGAQNLRRGKLRGAAATWWAHSRGYFGDMASDLERAGAVHRCP